MKKYWLNICVGFLVILLTACGGGGSCGATIGVAFSGACSESNGGISSNVSEKLAIENKSSSATVAAVTTLVIN
jgi:hypothetical protein